MAKRRKEKDEEEDKPFKIPKFDEKAFLKRERRNIKTSFLSVLFGGFMALICFGFWLLMGKEVPLRWELVFLVGFINAVFLRHIFSRLNIDLTDFGRKNWFASYAIYFFTWLIVFIVLVNPPFYDDEDPKIELIVLPGVQERGGDVLVIAKITDNSGIEKSNINFELTPPDDTKESPDFTFSNNVFEYTFDYTRDGALIWTEDGTYTFKLTATDSAGHSSTIEGSFKYRNSTIKVPEPLEAHIPPGPKVGYATTIKFDVDTQVSRVYYTVNDGVVINATKDDDGFFITSPKYGDWPKNQNVTVNVTAELVYYFENHIVDGEFVDYSNTIVDTQSYYFVVTDDPNVATEDSPKVKMPGPRIVYAPGFETVVLLIALTAVILIFKYKKKNRSNQK